MCARRGYDDAALIHQRPKERWSQHARKNNLPASALAEDESRAGFLVIGQ